MNQAFLDYFRCPLELNKFDEIPVGSADEPGPRPGWLGKGKEPFPCLPHEIPPFIADSLRDSYASDGVAHLCFNPSLAVDTLRQEKYLQPARRGAMQRLARTAYYGIRPILPVFARKHLQRIALRGWRRIAFPQWPVDATVDIMMRRFMRLLMRARDGEPVPFIWFWPEGRRAACMMTHDVETARGRNFCSELMDHTESQGFLSSFQVVPEHRYHVPESFRSEILERGFEFNIHGLNHDGNLFRERGEFLARVRRIHEYADRWSARGFRSPVLYRNADWMCDLPFDYDMSFPNVAHLDPQRGGCCTVTPYFLHHLVELPLTTTQDYTLFHILREHSIDLWKQQIQTIVSHHGLISFNIHPDYLLEPRAIMVYHRLLEHLRETAEREFLWCALPGEVASWWRDRSQMRLEATSTGEWRITGPGAGRARVAHARLEGERIVVEVRPDHTPAAAPVSY